MTTALRFVMSGAGPHRICVSLSKLPGKQGRPSTVTLMPAALATSAEKPKPRPVMVSESPCLTRAGVTADTVGMIVERTAPPRLW